MEGPPEIKCIFFSEFDSIAGPQIVHQVPEDYPLQDRFDIGHEYIITKPHLYNRLISVDLDTIKIAGCPKGIEDKSYSRNAFIFNFGFVFDTNVDLAPFEIVIRKLGTSFRDYEVENGFLKKEATRNELPRILGDVLQQLNSKGYCHVAIDDVNILNLKIIPPLSEPPEVHDYDVPIFICDAACLPDLEWDLAIKQVIPFIDGFNHITRIAEEADMDDEVVRKTVQHLVLYGFTTLISVFQFSNVYIGTDGLRELYADKDLRKWVVGQVSMPGHSPAFREVFKLYCSLEHGVTVKDLCMREEPQNKGIDMRLLIQVGLMKGFIRRLHKYPLLRKPDAELTELLADVQEMMDGKHHFDEICCHKGVSHQELDEAIDKCIGSYEGEDEIITVFWK
jgi:hypothetical protein